MMMMMLLISEADSVRCALSALAPVVFGSTPPPNVAVVKAHRPFTRRVCGVLFKRPKICL